MADHDLATVLAGLDVIQRQSRFRFERSADPRSQDGVHVVITEDGGTTVIVEDPNGEWAWLTLSVETDLELVGLTAAIAPALANRGIPCNIVAGMRHDHLLVPHAQVSDAIDRLRELRDAPDATHMNAGKTVEYDALSVEALTNAAALLVRLTHPAFPAVLAALHEAGEHGCTDRELVDAVDDDPKVVMGLCAALVDAGIVVVVDRRNRLTGDRPPAVVTTLRDLARGPLRVPRKLSGCVDNGRIAHYPRNPDDLDALLRCVVEVVGDGSVHREHTLSRRLATMADPAELRRRLVDRGFAERTSTGSRYLIHPLSS